MFVWLDFAGSNICRKWITGKPEETHFKVNMKLFFPDVSVHTFRTDTEPNPSEVVCPISTNQHSPMQLTSDSSWKLKACLINRTDLQSTYMHSENHTKSLRAFCSPSWSWRMIFPVRFTLRDTEHISWPPSSLLPSPPVAAHGEEVFKAIHCLPGQTDQGVIALSGNRKDLISADVWSGPGGFVKCQVEVT